MFYIIVENGIIVNRCVGTSDTSFPGWIKEEYVTDIGWKHNSDLNLYTPQDMTTEDVNNRKNDVINMYTEKKSFYERLVNSNLTFNSYPEETKQKITKYVEDLTNVLEEIKNNPGIILKELSGRIELNQEPIILRPNLDNEV